MSNRDLDAEQANKDLVRTAFEQWAQGTGGPFGLLADDASWTIVGNSVASRAYASRQEFLDTVIDPFNGRLATPLVPTVREIFAERGWVIVLFDAEATARDDKPYRNTYTWYLRIDRERIVEAIAFFDTVEFNEFWARVDPA